MSLLNFRKVKMILIQLQLNMWHWSLNMYLEFHKMDHILQHYYH